ncbi:hypothetical protein [Acanthopleuribacter pedis]|uniref:Lipoprotein n=1 Tax=Acanthopleuribacter pedis TaxID=442870 RepID=A0A8J7Q318_9BACT|nr:hypothetical protein [Acanthopleuribacter pedis]MBO1317202.1 hypothetical protein [Acanthopleuribacter pedis]
MKGFFPTTTGYAAGVLLVMVILGSSSCTTGVNYSQSLFNHIPADPELLVLVRPNDLTKLLEVSVEELDLSTLFDNRLDIDTKDIQRYKQLLSDTLEAVGIPWPKVESVGFMVYLEKPVVLISGEFTQQAIVDKMTELGFKQRANGYFDYVYDKMKVHVPADGLIMMGENDMLEFLMLVPDEQRLWNRPDFAEYRRVTPLDNSLFVWSVPPKNFLNDFEHRDQLSNVSLAMNVKNNVTLNVAVRLKTSQHATYLYDVVFGFVSLGRGIFGSDPELGPLMKSLQIRQEKASVVTTLVVPASQLPAIKDRLIKELDSQESPTLSKLKNFLDGLN